MIESVYNSWERFKAGEIDLGDVIEQLHLNDGQNLDEIPPALIVNLVHHLECAFEQGEFNGQLKLIKLLGSISTQSEAKITSYTKCLRSLADRASPSSEINDDVINQLFDLIESLIDPARNWQAESPIQTDSNCRLLGSVDSLIVLCSDLINSKQQQQQQQYRDLIQVRAIELIGVLLSSNQASRHLVLTEPVYQSLLAQLRARFDSNDDNITSKVIVRFIHQLHQTKGLPPFPLDVCIQPLTSALVSTEYALSDKLSLIQLLADCLAPALIDLHMLQAKLTAAGLHLSKLIVQMIDSDNKDGFILLRFMRRLTYNNQTARESIAQAWGGWCAVVDDLIKVVPDPMRLARELLDFVSS